jgi:hypothetical protein
MTAKPHTGLVTRQAALWSTCKPISHAALATSSFSVPRATTFIALSSSGRCSAFASSQGARIQTSRSSSVVRIRHGFRMDRLDHRVR